MGPLRLVARPMLASMFVSGGVEQLTDPASHVPIAEPVTDALKDATQDTIPQAADADAEQLVQLNGLMQVVGGLLLTFGKLPRVAALLLAGSLVPTTLAAHRFWEESDEETRNAQRIHFFKNVSLLGGLLIATMDREGKPSIAWRGGHAVDHAKIAADHAKEVTRLKGELASEKAKRKAANTARPDRGENLRLRKDLAKATAREKTKVGAGEHLKVRKDLAKKRLTPDVMDAKRLVGAFRSDDD